MRRLAIGTLLIACIAVGVPRTAQADDGSRPETKHLVLAGTGIAVPVYFVGVGIHEGTHALVAKVYGRELTRVQLLPGRHPRTGRFYFGYVQYRGRLPRGPRTLFLIAPKLVDLTLLGGYAALIATDALPENHYSQLALTVWATGFWIDFTKDLIAFWAPNDTYHALDRNGLRSFWDRLPYRLIHASLAIASSFAIIQGYQRVFDRADSSSLPHLAPILRGRF